MNVLRLQVAFNHDDSTIVARGLSEFINQISVDHDVTHNYGYNGFSHDHLSRPYNYVPVEDVLDSGILSLFLLSSPVLEELFVLWKLPDIHDKDHSFCHLLMQCIGLSLHCLRANTKFCTDMVNRILHEHISSIHTQLSSDDANVVHSTLGLILSMCRLSVSICRDIYQKVICNTPIFDLLAQRGKLVVKKVKLPMESSDDGDGSDNVDECILDFDSRKLVALISFTVYMSGDDDLKFQMSNNSKSVLRRVCSPLKTDNALMIRMLLNAIQNVFFPSYMEHDDGSDDELFMLQPPTRSIVQLEIFHSNISESVLHLCDSENHEDDDDVANLAHSTMVSYCHYLNSFLDSEYSALNKKTNGNVSNITKTHAIFLLKQLRANESLLHRELQMMVLSKQPQLLSICLNTHMTPCTLASHSTASAWDPVVSHRYICTISHVCFLLDHVSVVDVKLANRFNTLLTSRIKNAQQSTSIVGDKSLHLAMGLTKNASTSMTSETNLKNLFDDLVHGCMPGGLTKKDVQKMLLHKNYMLQHFGLSYLISALHRLQRVCGQSTSALQDKHRSVVESGLIASLFRLLLPEIQVLMNLKNRYIQTLAGNNSKDSDSSIRRKLHHLLYLLISTIDVLVTLIPSAFLQANIDFTRLLDDMIPWNSEQDCTVIAQSCGIYSVVDERILCLILRVLLKVAANTVTNANARWFGASEDAVKLLSNTIVSSSWINSNTKRSFLSKVLVLCCSDQSTTKSSPVQPLSRHLMFAILTNCGLFEGHDTVQCELSVEMVGWLDNVSCSDNSVLVFDVLLRVAYHWNAGYCMQSKENSAPSEESFSSWGNFMPFSPILYAGLCLANCDFSIQLDEFPKYMRDHIINAKEKTFGGASGSDEKSFLSKYEDGFCIALSGFMVHMVHLVSIGSRSMSDYLSCVSNASLKLAKKSMITRQLVMLSEFIVKSKPSKKDCDIPYAEALSAPRMNICNLKMFFAQLNSSSFDKQFWKLVKKSIKSDDNDALVSRSLRNLLMLASQLNRKIKWADLTPDTMKAYCNLMLASLVLDEGLDNVRATFELEQRSVVVIFSLFNLLTSFSNSLLGQNDLEEVCNSVVCSVVVAVEHLSDVALLKVVVQFLDSSCILEQLMENSWFGKSMRHILAAFALQCEKIIFLPATVLSTTKMTSNHRTTVAKCPDFLAAFWSKISAVLLLHVDIVGLGLVAKDSCVVTICTLLAGQMVSSKALTKLLFDMSLQDFNTVGSANAFEIVPRNSNNRDYCTVVTDVQLSYVLYSPLKILSNLVCMDKCAMESMCTKRNVVSYPMVRSQFLKHHCSGKSYNVPSLDYYSNTMSICSSSVADVMYEGVLDFITQTPPGGNEGSKKPSYFFSWMSHYCRIISYSSMLEVYSRVQSESLETNSNEEKKRMILAVCTLEFLANEIHSLDVIHNACRKSSDVELLINEQCACREYFFSVRLMCDASNIENFLLSLLQYYQSKRESVTIKSNLKNFNITVILSLFENVAKMLSFPCCRHAMHNLLSLFCKEMTDICGKFDLEVISSVSQLDILHLKVFDTLYFLAFFSLKCCSVVMFESDDGSKDSVTSFCGVWTEAYSCFLSWFLDDNLALLTTMNRFLSDVEDDNKEKAVVLSVMKQAYTHKSCWLAKFMCFDMPDTEVSTCDQLVESLKSVFPALRQKLNKWTKGSLKYGFEFNEALNAIVEVLKVPSWFVSQTGANDRVWRVVSEAETYSPTSDYFDAVQMLSMAMSHSKFRWTLRVNTMKEHAGTTKSDTSNGLLLMLVSLLKTVEGYLKIKGNSISSDKLNLDALVVELVPLYRGSLRTSDRLIRRMFYLFESSGLRNCLVLEKPELYMRVLHSDADIQNESNVAMKTFSNNWICNYSNLPNIYFTLSNFPFSREFEPTRLYLECPEEDLLSEEDDNGFEQRRPVDSMMNMDTHDGSVCDPSFWMPAAVFCLIQSPELSIRQLATSGILSLIITCLGCSCAILRSYSIAALQRIFILIQTQDREVDTQFRERPQLLLLLNFVRNSLDEDMRRQNETVENVATSVSLRSTDSPIEIIWLPPLIAVFLGRASLHLLQPQHELFSKINKYLLSRPCCDIKDTPLFDLLITNASNGGSDEVEHAERISDMILVLRLLRDGLNSKSDHLNLCRKNGYSHIMALFPFYSGNVGAGHAILDVLEKAMKLRFSARYLVERAAMLSWIHQMITLSCSGTLESAKQKQKNDNHNITDDHCSMQLTTVMSDCKVVSLKLSVHLLRLFRSVIGACYLLNMEGVESIMSQLIYHVNSIIEHVTSLVAFANLSSELYFGISDIAQELVSCMWDFVMVVSDVKEGKSPTMNEFYTNAFQLLEALSLVNDDLCIKPVVKETLIHQLILIFSFSSSAPFNNTLNPLKVVTLLCASLLASSATLSSEGAASKYVSVLDSDCVVAELTPLSCDRRVQTALSSVVHMFKGDVSTNPHKSHCKMHDNLDFHLDSVWQSFQADGTGAHGKSTQRYSHVHRIPLSKSLHFPMKISMVLPSILQVIMTHGSCFVGIVEWCLHIRNIQSNSCVTSTTALVNKGDPGEALGNRIVSLANPMSIRCDSLTTDFYYFQNQVQLAVIALICVFRREYSSKPSCDFDCEEELLGVLHKLLGGFCDAAVLVGKKKDQCMASMWDVTAFKERILALWRHDGDRMTIVLLCKQALDFVDSWITVQANTSDDGESIITGKFADFQVTLENAATFKSALSKTSSPANISKGDVENQTLCSVSDLFVNMIDVSVVSGDSVVPMPMYPLWKHAIDRKRKREFKKNVTPVDVDADGEAAEVDVDEEDAWFIQEENKQRRLSVAAERRKSRSLFRPIRYVPMAIHGYRKTRKPLRINHIPSMNHSMDAQ